MAKKQTKLLIVGQTPPPYGGQSVNIEKIIFILKKNNFRYRFVRMNFSDELSENGSVSLKKMLRLVSTFLKILFQLAVYRPNYVYYPPCGAEKVPMIRDILLLIPIRFFRFKVIYHFHAGGLSEIYKELSSPFRRLCQFAYFNAEYAICMSSQGKKDPAFLQAKSIAVIPYGVDKSSRAEPREAKSIARNFKVLFVGVCRESKGILEFLKIVEKCNSANSAIQGRIVGNIFSEKEEAAIKAAVSKGYVVYEGVKIGKEKHQIFENSEVFLFPTFFEHENFPTVILEAFSFGIPVISTKWRGVIDQIKDGLNGFIHDIHDIDGMATSIIELASNIEVYKKVSTNAIFDYNTLYTSERFEQNILSLFSSLK